MLIERFTTSVGKFIKITNWQFIHFICLNSGFLFCHSFFWVTFPSPIRLSVLSICRTRKDKIQGWIIATFANMSRAPLQQVSNVAAVKKPMSTSSIQTCSMKSRSISFRDVAMLANAVRRKSRSVEATFSRASEKWILTSAVDNFVLISRQSVKVKK